MITPAAGAVANGLCVVAFYSSSKVHGEIAAAAVADICWLLLGLPSRRYSKRLKASLTELFFSVFASPRGCTLALRIHDSYTPSPVSPKDDLYDHLLVFHRCNCRAGTQHPRLPCFFPC